MHRGDKTANGSAAGHLNPEFLVVLRQVSGADRLPADQPARSCGLLPQHRVPAV